MSRYDSKISSGLNSQAFKVTGCNPCKGSCLGTCSGSCKGFCSGGCRAVCHATSYKVFSLTGESDIKSR